MASPNSYVKRRSLPSNAREPPNVSIAKPPRSPGTRSFLRKSVLFALFLLALPLFPSQAPDFVGETVLTKFWELIHLLFIGVAVSYGLFSRRNVDSGADLQLRTSNVDESSLSYLSRMLHVSSFFDYESDFNRRNENGSIEMSVRIPTLDEENKTESSAIESQMEDSSEHSKINRVQAWNSQYFQGRSKVVVAQPSYGVDDYIGRKPLGLPVRSLSSALRDTEAPEDNCFSGSYDEAVKRGDFGSFDSLELEEKFDEVRAPSSAVPLQSRSERTSMREKLKGDGGAHPSNSRLLSVDKALKSTSFQSTESSSQGSFISQTQSRFSVGWLNSKTEEQGKQQSLQGSSQSASSSLSTSPSPSPTPTTDDMHRHMSHSRHYSEGSLFGEDGKRGSEEEQDGGAPRSRRTHSLSRKEHGSRSLKATPDSAAFCISDGDSPTRRHSQQKSCNLEENPTNLKGKLRSNLHKRIGGDHCSLERGTEGYDKDEKLCVSSPQKAPSPPMSAKASSHDANDARLGVHVSLLENDVKKSSEDSFASRRDLPKDLNTGAIPRWESNPEKTSNKPSLKGKSVRTVRSGRKARDGESSDGQRGRTKVRSQRQNLILSNGKSEGKIYNEEKKGKGKESCKSYIRRNEDELELQENKAEKPGRMMEEDDEEEEGGKDSVSDAGTDPNEVDRKAAEFIAKFREQIRLQKQFSGELPRGMVAISDDSAKQKLNMATPDPL